MARKRVGDDIAHLGQIPNKCQIDLDLVNFVNKFFRHSKPQMKSHTHYRSYTTIYAKEVVCFYDSCHFSGPSFEMPVRREMDGTLTTWGNFCSLECIRAYIGERDHTIRRDACFALLALMGRQLYGRTVRIEASPCYLIIDKFGGPLTIEEFREQHATHNMWVVRPSKSNRTALTYDVFSNNSVFSPTPKATSKVKKEVKVSKVQEVKIQEQKSENKKSKEMTQLFNVKRSCPSYVPKASIMTMLKRVQSQ